MTASSIKNHLTVDSILGYIFGILWIIGGSIGYFKSDPPSKASLVAGGSVGLLAMAGVFFAAQFSDKERGKKLHIFIENFH